MPTTNIAPFLKQRYFDANGNPLAGGKLYTYQAGTTTPQATYTDSTAATPNANPVVLDANGEANVWLDISLSYKFILKNSSEVTQWTVDNVIGLAANDAIPTNALQNLSVTTAKLADDSVTAAKLADDASIDANRAVTTNHIRDNAINRNKMDASTTTSNYQNENLTVTATVAANAMTIGIKTLAGAAPSATDYINRSFRSGTATSGTYAVRKSVAAITDLVIPNGASLGYANNDVNVIYVYEIDYNSGTPEIMVCGTMIDEGTLVSTTAISAASTSRIVPYSANARSNVPARLRARVLATQATAGVHASSPSEIALAPFYEAPKIAYLELTGSTAKGSTLTQVVRWTTVTEDKSGTAWTLTQSATNGDSITINESGIYALDVSFGGTSGADWAASRNNSGAVSTLTNTQQLVIFETPGEGVGRARTLNFTGKLEKGDVIRVNSNTVFQSTNGYGCSLKLTQIAKY